MANSNNSRSSSLKIILFLTLIIKVPSISDETIGSMIEGEFKHEVRQFEKSYDNQQAEQISLMV